ncbi:hypothetical protein CANARDRAFT_191502, partial [[Candida] arabinofermentans NRRL YB-2248]
EPIYLLAIPITTKKSFIYCKYTSSTLPGKSESYDTKIIRWAETQWIKFTKSEISINVKIVSFINKLLDTIPWYETCFRSIPSQNKIARFLKKNNNDNNKESTTLIDTSHKITHQDLQSSNLTINDLHPIPLYYPAKLTTSTYLFKELKDAVDHGKATHTKNLAITSILLPLSLPIALVPVIPNVPGFYLAYRAYCHLTALNGVKHLRYLLGGDGDGGESHLDLRCLKDENNITQQYLSTTNNEIKKTIELFMKENESSIEHDEKLLLDESNIGNVCEAMHVPELKGSLTTAVMQELKKMNKLKL